MKNKLKAYIILTVLPMIGYSQEEVQAVVETTTSNPLNYNHLIGALFLIFLVYATLRLLDLMARHRDVKLYNKFGFDVFKKQKQVGWWERMKRLATNAVPLEKEKDVQLDHEYDGIRELDNDLPPWWLWMFYITCIIGAGYMAYYHVFDLGMSQVEKYEMEMAAAKEDVEDFLADQADLVDETNVTLLTDAASLAEGKKIFQTLCAVCHQTTGAGGVGPNLTDNYWVHGGSIVDVFTTVKYGVPEKGMISWKTQMSAGDMHKVSSYILTLVGTNPPDQKAAEGELYIPPEEPVTPTEETEEVNTDESEVEE